MEHVIARSVVLLLGGLYMTPGIVVVLSDKIRAKAFAHKWMGIVGVAYLIGGVIVLVVLSS
jgi:hypothetical protein